MERKYPTKDYELYNEVMDILNSDWSRSEDEILEEIAQTTKHDGRVSLSNFLNDNMEAAINRSMGKTKSSITSLILLGLILHRNSLEDATEMPVDVITRNRLEHFGVGLRYVTGKCRRYRRRSDRCYSKD